MSIYSKKKYCIISIFLFLLCFISADFSLAEQKGTNATGNGPYFYYTIQKGDTLWDLSRKFYNSNWVWPGLWGINGQIKNPHRIYPGEKIKIFLRETITAQEPIVPVKKIDRAVKHEIHPTLYYPGMDRLGFIRKEAVNPLGRIIKSVENQIMMSKNDIIYIEPLGDEPLIPGKKYRIFTTEKISRKYSTGKFRGVKHTIKGIIEILANNGEYLTAKIIQSFKYASEGDLIMAYKKSGHKIEVKDAVKDIDARIICSEDKNNLISDHSIAFINCGSNDRIKAGQLYSIFQKQKARISHISKKRIALAPLKIGRLIVLRTERKAATVMILSAKKTVRPGYSVR